MALIQKIWDFISKGSDMIFAFGIVTILLLMIFPIPSWLMDFALAISLAISILILMTSLFIEKPIDFSSFPIVLLVSTIMRLALNIASSRLILTHGHEGSYAAGAIIRAFASVIISGNLVIGIIVFCILAVINFVVITKGSGRIAEVAARFVLDALPGKQMAIDSDLAAGIINDTEAKQRRKNLAEESNFFGAMDGAAKFVRGDAIAGIIIIVVNIIGGVIVGTLQKNIALKDAMRSYTILTIGDGLVAQIPGLIVSVAAGLVVAKTTQDQSSDKAIFSQIGRYRNALLVSSILLFFIAIIPGMPKIPFVLLCICTSSLVALQYRKVPQEAPVVQEAVATSTAYAPVLIEFGMGLLDLINNILPEKIRLLRKQFYHDYGFSIPIIHLQDNIKTADNSYKIYIKDIEAGSGTLYHTKLMLLNNSTNDDFKIEGIKDKDPTFGLPVMWIDKVHRNRASELKYTIIEPYTVVITHLSELLKDNMSELLDYSTTQQMVDELAEIKPRLVKELVPQPVSISMIQRVMQKLVQEKLPVKDLGLIIETIAENPNQSVLHIAEAIRIKMARYISKISSNNNGIIQVITLNPILEKEIMSSFYQDDLSLSPDRLHEIALLIANAVENLAVQGKSPSLLVNAKIRPHIKNIVERSKIHINVIAYTEIHKSAKINILEQL